jgi:hypothetical protein
MKTLLTLSTLSLALISTTSHADARGPLRLLMGHSAANRCCDTAGNAATDALRSPLATACDHASSVPADAAQFGLSFKLNMILTGQISQLSDEVAELRQAAAQNASDRDTATNELATTQQTLQQAENDLLAMTDRLRAAEEKAAADATAMSEQLAAVLQENENLKAQLEASTAQAQELQKTLDDAQAARKKSDEEKEDALKKLAEIQATKTEEPEVTTEPEPAQPDPNAPPAEVPTETPTEVPTDTPAEVPTETPAEVPTETPAEVPTETPTEVPATE